MSDIIPRIDKKPKIKATIDGLKILKFAINKVCIISVSEFERENDHKLDTLYICTTDVAGRLTIKGIYQGNTPIVFQDVAFSGALYGVGLFAVKRFITKNGKLFRTKSGKRFMVR